MAGTKEGGIKAAEKIIERHGKDFFKTIGKRGGLAKVSKGFGANRELAARAGRIGGSRKKKKQGV